VGERGERAKVRIINERIEGNKEKKREREIMGKIIKERV
jgi:hypothetical protein